MPHSIPLLTVTPYTESSLQRPYDADASGPVMLEDSVSADVDWPQLLPESWTLPTAWNRFYFDRKNDFTEEGKKRAWDKTAEIVKEYSDEMVQRWKEEIDTLLVYAGLFSAVLTGLIVESYTLLTPPPPDPVLIALRQISTQLNSFSISSSFINSTQPAAAQATFLASPVPRWAVSLNTLWFSSLICSLSSASVGIMVKQWLHEYRTGLSSSTESRHFARLRQHRLGNLEKWHVAGIVAVLPVLLQIALAFFLSGLLVLLWNINEAVAAAASVLIGVLFIFTIGSSLVPAFRADCPYLSPQVHALFTILHSTKAATLSVHRSISARLHSAARLLKLPADSDNGHSASRSKWPWVGDMSWTLTWRGRELHRFSEALDTLDVAMVTKAYAITMDQSYLSSYAPICFSDFQRGRQVVACYQGIVSVIWSHQQNTDDIPLSIQSDVSLAVTVDPDSGGGDRLPNVQRFWEHLSHNNLYRPDSSLGHLFANGIIEDNNSIARSIISWDTDGLPYGVLTDTVRQRAALSLQRVLQEEVQNTEYTSLRLCSDVLCTLISWVSASSSSAKETEDVETAHAIRALTRHGILCYFKGYSTDHGRMLSIRDNAERVIRNLHILCEKRSEDFMTPELVDALGHVYDVHKSEFSDPPWFWPEAKEDEVWILQLKCELDGSRKTEDSDITTREDVKSPPESEGAHQAVPTDAIYGENGPDSSDTSACADQEQQVETHEPTLQVS